MPIHAASNDLMGWAAVGWVHGHTTDTPPGRRGGSRRVSPKANALESRRVGWKLEGTFRVGCGIAPFLLLAGLRGWASERRPTPVRIDPPAPRAVIADGALLVRGSVKGCSDSEVGVSVNGFPALVSGHDFAAVIRQIDLLFAGRTLSSLTTVTVVTSDSRGKEL